MSAPVLHPAGDGWMFGVAGLNSSLLGIIAGVVQVRAEPIPAGKRTPTRAGGFLSPNLLDS